LYFRSTPWRCKEEKWGEARPNHFELGLTTLKNR
jgi:hypothetical protein